MKSVCRITFCILVLLIGWEIGEWILKSTSYEGLKLSNEALPTIVGILIGSSTGILALIGFLIALLTMNNQAIIGKIQELLLKLTELTSSDKYGRGKIEDTENAVSEVITNYKIIGKSRRRKDAGDYIFLVKLIIYSAASVWFVVVLLFSVKEYHLYVLILKVLVALLITGLQQYIRFFESLTGLAGFGKLPTFEKLMNGDELKDEVSTINLLAAGITASFRKDRDNPNQFEALLSGFDDKITNVYAAVNCEYFDDTFNKVSDDSPRTTIIWKNTAMQPMKDFIYKFSSPDSCSQVKLNMEFESKEGKARAIFYIDTSELSNIPTDGILNRFGKRIPMEKLMEFAEVTEES